MTFAHSSPGGRSKATSFPAIAYFRTGNAQKADELAKEVQVITKLIKE